MPTVPDFVTRQAATNGLPLPGPVSVIDLSGTDPQPLLDALLALGVAARLITDPAKGHGPCLVRHRADAAATAAVLQTAQAAGNACLVLCEGRDPDAWAAFAAIGVTDFLVWPQDADQVSVRLLRLQAIASCRHHYRAVLQGIPDPMFRVDAEGRFIDYHVAEGQSLFVAAKQIVGTSLQERLPAHVADAAMAAVRAALATGTLQTFEYDLQIAGGVRYWEARVVPSGPQETTIVCRDLTDVRTLQANLILSERMASLGMLAAGVGHEINNPLTYVTANIDLALGQMRTLPDPAGPTVSKAIIPLLDAKSGAERMRQIVRNLKMFSRADVNDLTAVDLTAVVESSLDLAMNQIRARARIVADLQRVDAVMANAAALGQVAVNLIINAMQAIPPGRAADHTITVTVRPGEAGTVVLSVQDSGLGIPASVLPRIFDPFFSTKAGGEGTGLGLSICHSIVSGLGGRIEVASEVDRGSVFQVILPTTPSPACGPPPPAVAPAARPARILVIDDTPEIAALIERMLETDHEVIAVLSARHALARLAAGEGFDVILCDLMMPDMTGMALHGEIQGGYPALLPRLAFMTGGAFTAEASRFLKDVPNLRLDKPFLYPELTGLIRAVLETASRAATDGVAEPGG